VGGLRAANFAKSLLSLGWRPHVLTIRKRDVTQLDPQRGEGLQDIAVHAARVLPTVEGVYGAIARRLRRQGRPASSVPPHASAAPTSIGAVPERLARRVRRYILSFLALPDRERGWILPATLAAVRHLRQDDIEWFMTSCPPYSVHVVGLLVKRLTGRRWIADFRDPWMTTGTKRLYPTCGASRWLESRLERRVMEKADLLLFNVERLRDAYRDRYRDIPREKFVFIPNAVPATKRSHLPPAKYGPFTLCYTGSLYLGRSPEPVCAAVARLISERKATAGDVRIKLVGECREVDGVPTASLARKYDLESVMEVCDPVPHAEALDIVSRSHLALLFAPQLPFQIPAKVYEYLGAGTRILAIAEAGGTADLVRDTEAGQAFSSSDVDGISRFIHDEMTSRASKTEKRPASLKRFEAHRLTEELVGHLGRVDAAREMIL
jgi:hypothetical protein